LLLFIENYLLIIEFNSSQFKDNFGNSNEYLNIKTSNFKYTNITIISDLYRDSIWGTNKEKMHTVIYSEYINLDPIIIDDLGGGNYTWAQANTQGWCSGLGISTDPYIIESLKINGYNSSSCITIRNSNVFFLVRNCMFYNSSYGIVDAGIILDNVFNGKLIQNNCSHNEGFGIKILNCENVNVSGNIVNYNQRDGISLSVSSNACILGNTANKNSQNGISLVDECYNNSISKNTVYDNIQHGIVLRNRCYNNSISKNMAYINSFEGIYIEGSNNTILIGNNAYSNSHNGISCCASKNNIISGNKANNNNWSGFGLYNGCYNNTYSRNTANNNWQGIYIENSSSTLVIGNIFNGNENHYTVVNVVNGSGNNFLWNIFSGYTDPIIIDDIGEGDFTWTQAINQLAWINGSGTSDDPFTIENIIIDGQNSGSCIEIGNSDKFLEIINCIFIKSGSRTSDAGIKLYTVTNVKLINNDCSENNSTGIFLSYCENIYVLNNTLNNNARDGIALFESDNNYIENNAYTINFNSKNGILLNSSYYNKIRGNTINYNLVGIYFFGSSYNIIINNDLRYNTKGAVVQKGGSTSNTFTENIPSIGNGDGLLIYLLIIIISAGIIFVIVISGTIVWKKRTAIPKKAKKEKVKLKEEEGLEKKKLKKEKERQKIEEEEIKVEQDLQKRIADVDHLIKENKLNIAIENLVEIQKKAQFQNLIHIVNKAEEKIFFCQKSEMENVTRIKQTILSLGAKFNRLQLVDISEKSGIKDEVLIESIIQDMIRNKEIQGEYFSSSKALALEVAVPVPTGKKVAKHNVFISYSTLDTDYFKISEIVNRLKLYPEINEVLFWEADSKQNIVEFMEETLKKTDTFVLFCSDNSMKSESVKGEWQSAYQIVKKGLMKIIPVYEVEECIPRLLWQMLNVKYMKDDFEGFIHILYKEILR